MFGPCIYCGLRADGDEHWLPRALGSVSGYKPLVDRLCKQCNPRLGALDEELIEVYLDDDEELNVTSLTDYLRQVGPQLKVAEVYGAKSVPGKPGETEQVPGSFLVTGSYARGSGA
jgi:hypothetical protein